VVSDGTLQYPVLVPPLVAAATVAAEGIGFADGAASSCRLGFGAVLAATHPAGPAASTRQRYSAEGQAQTPASSG
jgi:hypothetical protein